MNSEKQSKRALRSLISDSIKEALANLDLPKPSKKIKKLLDSKSKKLAELYADVLKREDKKRRKAEKQAAKALTNGSTVKKKKATTSERLVEPIKL